MTMKKETDKSLRAEAERIIEQGGTGREIALLLTKDYYRGYMKGAKPLLPKKISNALSLKIRELPDAESRAAVKYLQFAHRVAEALSDFQELTQNYVQSVHSLRANIDTLRHAEADAKLFEIICRDGIPYTDSQADTEARRAIKNVLDCYDGLIFVQATDGSISLEGAAFFDRLLIKGQTLLECLREYLPIALAYESLLKDKDYSDFMPEYAEKLVSFAGMEPAPDNMYSRAYLRELKEKYEKAKEKGGKGLTKIEKEINLIEKKGYYIYFPDVDDEIKRIDAKTIRENRKKLTYEQ